MLGPRTIRIALVALTLALLAGWRSELYPVDWEPGFEDGAGRFLHDFSYAGYRGGESDIPVMTGPVVNVVDYGADPSGNADSTGAIQQAIDEVSSLGGGVVYLAAGTYRVAPPAGRTQALHIGASGVVLRGAGPSQTHLLNASTDMRGRHIIDVRPNRDQHYTWYANHGDERMLTIDRLKPTTSIFVSSVDGYSVGDWIVIRSDATAEFLAEHGMLGVWDPEHVGVAFYREIVAVDSTQNLLTIDVPTRYPLQVRDAARIHRAAAHISEVGIEALAIGNLENPIAGTETDDYQVAGTGGYQMHASWAIYMNGVVNGWVRDVATFRPDANEHAHLLSNGIRLDATRFVTIRDCDFRNAQYQGAGGNGYLIVLTGSENLVTHCRAEGGRHNYGFSLMYSSGNVIHRSASVGGRLPVDFHMQLSMANLIDSMTLDDDSLEAVERECCGHGHSTTQSVLWNTNGARYPRDQWLFKFIVDTDQLGHGYVIGTRGSATKVRAPSRASTAPTDWVEGVGEGATLKPESLYEDQLARRLGTWELPGPGPEDTGPKEGDDPDGEPSEGGSHGCSAARPPGAGQWVVWMWAVIAVRRRRRAS